MNVRRVTEYVEVQSLSGDAVFTLSRDEPRADDTGKRNPYGYVSVYLTGASEAYVFAVGTLRRALDEFERESFDRA